MDISLRHLQQVRMLARYRHFGRAADALAMSQPALTRSIQNLERALGVTLFDRHQRGGIEPTEFGELLLDRGQAILLDSEELQREVQLLKGLETGKLVVDTGYFPAELSVNRAVGRLLRRHPKLTVKVRLSDWREATRNVLHRQTDLAVGEISQAAQDPRLECELLSAHPFVFTCRPGHPLLHQRKITMADLFSFPFAATRGPARIAAMLPEGKAGYLENETGDFVPAVLVEDFASALQVAAESDALAAAPPLALATTDYSRKLREVPFHAPWMVLQYGFIYLQGRTLSAAARALMEEITAIEKDLQLHED